MPWRHRLWILLIFLFLGCKPKEEQFAVATDLNIVEFISDRYPNGELDQLDSDYRSYIDIGLEYHLSYVRVYERSESKLLDTFFVNSSLNRALLLIATRSEGEEHINSSIQPEMAFLHNEKWYFLPTDGVHMIQAADAGTTRLMTFEELAEYARAKLLKGYLLRDLVSDEIRINDLFFRNYMDNNDLMRLGEKIPWDSLGYVPDSFWTNKYMSYIEFLERRIELIREERVEQDSLRTMGQIDDQEWAFIQRMRNPQTHQDWRKIDSIHRGFNKDSTMRILWDKALNFPRPNYTSLPK